MDASLHSKVGYLCCLVILCLVRECGGQEAQVSSCLPPGTTTPASQPDQPTLPNSFHVKAEVASEESNSTLQTEEVVDGDGNRAVLKTLIAGKETTIIFYYNTQEIIYITENNCTVHNMTSDPERFSFFGETMVDGRGHIPDGASALYFGPNITKVYKGRTEVRGIPCDWWHSCLNWPSQNTTFTIDYYFSVKDWATASTAVQIPVRYDINGSTMMGNGTRILFHRINDFFGFMPDVDTDPSIFQTPEGVVCPGRKSTQDIPALTSHFYHFKEEMIDVYHGLISNADVWYDLDNKLVRVDYRSPSRVPPLYTTNPLSEVHDLNYGVRYVKDRLSGQCSPMALQERFDAQLDAAAYRVNDSYVMSMKNPLSFFFLDSNFVYSGQRTARDALCDVYISHRYDFDYFNNGSALEAKVEAYFLADGWADNPNDALVQYARRFPFRVHLWIPKMQYNLVYNVFDYDTERPEISVFDITDCYDDSSIVNIKVRFPGPYRRDTEHMVRLQGQNALAMSMQVSPLRVNNLQVTYDTAYLYLTATLLDRTPSLAQFTHLPNAVVERNDDYSFANVANASVCSDLCVQNTDITCLSFEYCPTDRGACRLSRLHVSDGTPTVVSGTCDLYSRTVNVGGSPQLTVTQAITRLRQDVKDGNLYFDVGEDNQQNMQYVAVDVEILFGRMTEVTLPTLTGQFSYRVELVYPRHSLVNTYDVWYDSVSKLVRYDTRDASAGPPFYTPFTVSTIYDFNTGVSYNVDTYAGNCSMRAISTNSSVSAPMNLTSVHLTGREVISMKDAVEMFYLDDSYTFVGQKTVRGILCDVFESRRTDFSLGQGQEHTIFQYFFQSSTWEYESDTHEDITLQQPVQLLILDEEENEFIIYNFYDFNDEATAYDKFNIAPCFTDNQRIEFEVAFNQSYHPYLDTRESEFRTELQQWLTSVIRVSPLRLQNVQLTYNLDQTFATATLLGEAPPILHFAETGTTSPYTAKVAVQQTDVTGCAANCYYDHTIVCNSFDLCPDQVCYLSTMHVPDGHSTGSNVTCRHFSRTVNGTEPEPALEDAFTALKDAVYKGLLVVTMQPHSSSQDPVSYTAVSIRDDLQRDTPPTETGGADLHTKFTLYKSGQQMSGSAMTLGDTAVDECATACLSEEMFDCNSFSYCYTTGRCFLNTNMPDTNQDLLSPNPFCDVYTRKYLDSYHLYPGQVMEGGADSVVSARSSEQCAHLCSATTNINCRSFDVCPTTGHCLLRHRHALDPEATLTNTSFCSHYSRSYLPDFSLHVHQVVMGHDDTVIDAVAAHTCAFECIKEDSCQSFEFCQGQCRLSSVLPGASLITDSDTCDLYTITASAADADRGTTLTPARTPTSTPTSTSTRTPPRTPAPVTSRHTQTVPPPAVSSSTPAPAPTSSATSSNPDVRSTDPGAGVTTGCVRTQKSSGDTDDTGPRVGIAVGVLVLGVLLGAGLVLLLQRILGKSPDQMEMELVPRFK